MESVHLCTIIPDPVHEIDDTDAQSSAPKGGGEPPSEEIADMAMVSDYMWTPGETIRIKLLGGTSNVQKMVKKYARGWLEHANLKMNFVKRGDADIRVSFIKGGGSWSVIGTSCRNVPKDQATMNFGWFTDTTPEMEFSRTVLHEFGHALGCIHEHQSPAGNIPWDKKAVYKYYKQTLGWDKPKVRRNIFKAYSIDITQFSSFDKESIMLYSFPSSLTKGEFFTKPNSTLSNADKRFIAEAYPGRRARVKVQPEPEGRLTRIKKALDGPWRGYYYYSDGRTDGLSILSLTTRRARDDGKSVAITGSGSDSVGYFTIKGDVYASGRVSRGVANTLFKNATRYIKKYLCLEVTSLRGGPWPRHGSCSPDKGSATEWLGPDGRAPQKP
ncbi:hypothetical protein GGTG_08036 [Gaeumannomyces tritici R3-111a-1]|uniref:Peptidase metallopeptidase domain-containing protein n=1 Tax=Gaeumannomyces tritici (strain R3-111a-1) TaxID=644352 RepID=J3P3E9_GAET3|nr:hypothetical protein GGTG_08036 [Gaeumannomyces tritici R3-111a-1]EJT74191.1 hypothetical protein GGTG_08036 [Gaeumannomyces tritici R3-111a-1]